MYVFLLIPFGLRMPQDIFQRRILPQTHKNCQSAVGLADDFQVFGHDLTDDLHLPEEMRKWREPGRQVVN